ncbi:MAG: hypothetical protein HYV27_08320 [Candidatus Hydrogenedentes bacterium]|nr:hypothetical protein [Candidatus Hydrogenedentota bacterium]
MNEHSSLDHEIVEKVLYKERHLDIETFKLPNGSTGGVQFDLGSLKEGFDKLLRSSILSARSSDRMERITPTIKALATTHNNTSHYATTLDEEEVDVNYIVGEIYKQFAGRSAVRSEKLNSSCEEMRRYIVSLKGKRADALRSSWLTSIANLWVPPDTNWSFMAAAVGDFCQSEFRILPPDRNAYDRLGRAPIAQLHYIYDCTAKDSSTPRLELSRFERFLKETHCITKYYIQSTGKTDNRSENSSLDIDARRYEGLVSDAMSFVSRFGIRAIVCMHQSWIETSKGTANLYFEGLDPEQLAKHLARRPITWTA